MCATLNWYTRDDEWNHDQLVVNLSFALFYDFTSDVWRRKIKNMLEQTINTHPPQNYQKMSWQFNQFCCDKRCEKTVYQSSSSSLSMISSIEQSRRVFRTENKNTKFLSNLRKWTMSVLSVFLWCHCTFFSYHDKMNATLCSNLARSDMETEKSMTSIPMKMLDNVKKMGMTASMSQ